MSSLTSATSWVCFEQGFGSMTPRGVVVSPYLRHSLVLGNPSSSSSLSPGGRGDQDAIPGDRHGDSHVPRGRPPPAHATWHLHTPGNQRWGCSPRSRTGAAAVPGIKAKLILRVPSSNSCFPLLADTSLLSASLHSLLCCTGAFPSQLQPPVLSACCCPPRDPPQPQQ